jgi:predicted DNA-binding antitoxin AbrB/MazE fold protein
MDPSRQAMTTAVKAIYEDGVFKPTEPVDLRERTEVEVLIPSPASTADDDDPTGWRTAEELIGCVEDAPIDMAENHDLYLYGRPRR